MKGKVKRVVLVLVLVLVLPSLACVDGDGVRDAVDGAVDIVEESAEEVLDQFGSGQFGTNAVYDTVQDCRNSGGTCVEPYP